MNADQILYDRFGVPDPLAITDQQIGRPLAAWLRSMVDGIFDNSTGPNLFRVGIGTDTRTGWADALDLDAIPDAWLPWLAQFVGVQLDPHLEPATARTIIRTREGWARGTPATMVTVARRFLDKPTAKVFIDERTPTPYSFGVSVYRSDLVSFSNAELAATGDTYAVLGAKFPRYVDMGSGLDPLIRALTTVKPAGLRMTVTAILGGATYSDVDTFYGTYADMGTAVTTYEALSDLKPPGA